MVAKRLSIALLSIFISVVAFAANKDLEKDITMVAYEQSWLDDEGTLALKNNLNDEVNNVVFLITYLDMAGNELDYEVFSKNVNIAPGMTKKLNIPAYEHHRSYYYYKSKGSYSDESNKSFKIKFQLKDYKVGKNVVEESVDDNSLNSYDYDNPSGNGGGILTITVLVGIYFFIGITAGLYVLVAAMAQKRNRNVCAWVFMSIILTPLLMIIILMVIGKNENYIDNHYNKN